MLHESSLNPGFSCKACVLTTRALGWFCFTLARFTLEEVARGIIDVGVLTSFAWVTSRHTLGPSPLATLLSGNTDQGRLFVILGFRLLSSLAETAALSWRGVWCADGAARSCAALLAPTGPAATCIHSGCSSTSAHGQVTGFSVLRHQQVMVSQARQRVGRS